MNESDVVVTSASTRAISSVVPTLRYRDLAGAVDWLCAAFGFTAQSVAHGADGSLVLVQLRGGSGLIMLTGVGDGEFDRLMKQPDEIGGAETQSCYFVVKNCDAHYENAVVHGAGIVLALQDFEHGGRGYLARDPEGHLWSFGSFDPRAAGRTPLVARLVDLNIPDLPKPRTALAGLAALGVAAAATAASLSWQGAGQVDQPPPRPSAIQLFKERGARIAAEGDARRLTAELTRTREEKEAVALDGDKWREELAHLQGAKETAESARQSAETAQQSSDAAAKRLQEQVSEVRQARLTAEKSARFLLAKSVYERQVRERSRRRALELGDQLAAERQSKQRSDKAVQDLKSVLDKEIAARAAAEKSLRDSQAQLGKEREAKKRLELSLRTATEQSKKEQEAGKPADTATKPPADKAAKLLRTPQPAKRPAGKQRAKASGDALPDFVP